MRLTSLATLLSLSSIVASKPMTEHSYTDYDIDKLIGLPDHTLHAANSKPVTAFNATLKLLYGHYSRAFVTSFGNRMEVKYNGIDETLLIIKFVFNQDKISICSGSANQSCEFVVERKMTVVRGEPFEIAILTLPTHYHIKIGDRWQEVYQHRHTVLKAKTLTIRGDRVKVYEVGTGDNSDQFTYENAEEIVAVENAKRGISEAPSEQVVKAAIAALESSGILTEPRRQ